MLRRLLLLSSLLARSALLAGDASLIETPSSLVYPDFWHTPMGVHRGTPKLLDFFLSGQAQFNNPEGLACTRMLESGPESPQLTVFGVNSGAGQIIYNPDMYHLALFGIQGSLDGQFENPIGIACLPDGRVAVADSGNNRIVLLQYHGGLLSWRGNIGSEGSGPGQFKNPTWLAYDSQGCLYVSDTGNNRVQIFNSDGSYRLSFGADPEANNSLIEPQAIAVVDPKERHSSSPVGAIFVVDQYHGRLQRFDLSGRFMGDATAEDADRYLVYYSGIALDYYNNLWVVDQGNDQILKFDQYLQFVDSWGSRGEGDYYLNSPRGIAIYRHFGQFFVAERDAAQYLWIGSDVKDIRVSRAEDPDGKVRMRVDYRLTENANLAAWIENPEGSILAPLFPLGRVKQGAQTAYWDGTMSNGQKIQPGKYLLEFQAEALYSSASYFKKSAKKIFWVK